MTAPRRTVDVVAAVIRKGDKVLAMQRGYGEFKDGWEFPGGKVEPGESPEQALVNPDNLYILLNHVKCAAYELPFADGELFGGLDSTGELLDYLTEQGLLMHVAGRYHWMAEEFPQAGISLRSACDQNFVIIDISNPAHHRVIGEMDRFTVPMLLHQYAIYMH